MKTPTPRLFLLGLAVVAATLAALAPTAAAIGPGAYPPGDCRTGTPSCSMGCCTKACPSGSAGAAIPSGVPGLAATINGLTYDPKTALVKGTLIVTNTGKTPFPSLYAGLQFAYLSIDNMWCGGQKGKALAAGASVACPFAIVGGVDPAKDDWTKQASREPQPGVDPAALKAAWAFSTSDVLQTPQLQRGLKPSAVSVAPKIQDVMYYPVEKSMGFICGFSFVPAVAAKAN